MFQQTSIHPFLRLSISSIKHEGFNLSCGIGMESLSDMTIYQFLFVSVESRWCFFPTQSCTKNLDPDFLPKKLTWNPSVEFQLNNDRENDIPFPIVPIELFLALEQIRKSLGYPNYYMISCRLECVHCDWTLDFLPRFQEILLENTSKNFFSKKSFKESQHGMEPKWMIDSLVKTSAFLGWWLFLMTGL